MNVDMARNALLLCSVIDYGLLILWFLLFMLPHQWMYRLCRRSCGLTSEQFDAVNFAGIVLFKILIILFNIVPYVALRIVG
ncbi:MAG: DUF6868 family protein [Blastocatellia bacterium]